VFPLAPKTTRDRIACESLIGLSVGDALGARFEGVGFDAARLEMVLERDGIAAWTDDTQMAVSIVERLMDDGTIDQDRLAEAFGRRYESWRGYGMGMHIVLPEIGAGKDWRDLKERVFPGGSFGNGSAMRVAPLGAYFHDAPVDTVVLEAKRSAEVTHAHPEALGGAAATAIGAWLAARSRGRDVPDWAELFSAVRTPLDPSLTVTRGVGVAATLEPSVGLAEAVAQLGNGSKVSCPDTVPLALWLAFQFLDDFPAAIRHAVAAGGDTDTVAAIVGGIVASRVGVESIPIEWRQGVEPVPVEL
jgi:ADP-ribosylglycohydrolase